VLEEGRAPAAQLARHALASGLAEQAFGYSVAAGDQAMEVFAARDAIEHYERARNLLAEEGVRTGGARQLGEPSILDLEHLHTQLGQTYELINEWGKARAAYETMLALAQEVGEARLEVVALNHLAILAFHQEACPPRAKVLLEEARRVAEEAGLKEALVETECNLVDVMGFWTGEFEGSRPLAEKALASARALLEHPDLVARALTALAREEMYAGRLEESAAYAEEGAALSRELAERPAPPRAELPSMLAAVMGIATSWKAGTKAMETQCLTYLAYDRIFQGRLQEGVVIAREARSISRELPARMEAQSSAALSLGLVECGEYEEALELSQQSIQLARKAQNTLLLWLNLDKLGRAYEVLQDLKRARTIHEEVLELGGPAGPQYEAFPSTRLCGVAALSENWEEAYAHMLRAREAGTSFNLLDSFYLPQEVEALLRGGDERLAREEMLRFAQRAQINQRDRLAYLRSSAVLSEWEGDTQRAIGQLREAEMLAEKIGLPGELWQIRAEIGELYARRGETWKTQEAYSRAAQTLRMLAGKIGDEELRKGFLSAPRVHRVLERN
jgi:tetratricopeptide (TPR) repeat protein